MFKNKEKDFYLQTPEEVKDCPPVIASIAQGVSDCLELETEMGAFVYDEDDQLADLLLMLYKEKNYRAAVQLLKMVFGVTGNESAVTLLSLIHPGNGEKTEEMFMKAFMYSVCPLPTRPASFHEDQVLLQHTDLLLLFQQRLYH